MLSDPRERLCCTLAADEGQKLETAVQGLHLLSFDTVNLIFMYCIYMYMYIVSRSLKTQQRPLNLS